MTLTVLFIPVSSAKGIGEYMRSLTIAEALRENTADINIHFILNQQAPYRTYCPFPVHLTPGSPTKHNAEVKQIIASVVPDVVIFDAAGRAEQLAYCHQRGIKTVFICPRAKKIKRAMTWRRLRYTDRIWIAQPEFAIKPFSWWDKFKFQCLRKSLPLIAGPIFKEPNEQLCQTVLQQYGLTSGDFVVVNAGSGGHSIEATPTIEIFAEAARELASQLKCTLVLVKGMNSPALPPISPHIKVLEHLPIDQFNALLKHARIALLAGGSALLQALSFKTIIVAVALTAEQKQRVKRFRKLGLVVESPCHADTMVKAVCKAEEFAKTNLQTMDIKLENVKIENGLTRVVEDFRQLMEGRQTGG